MFSPKIRKKKYQMSTQPLCTKIIEIYAFKKIKYFYLQKILIMTYLHF